jgi:hypothetical protein
MKTLRTIATVMLAALLVLGPTVAFAAGETVTVSTDANSYSGTQIIHVSGTVTPAPAAAGSNVVIKTTGPSGVADVNSIAVPTSGAFTYTIAPGSSLWTTGSYTVNATYGGPGGTGSAVSTFSYQSSGPGSGSISVSIVTATITTTVTTTVATNTVTNTVTVPGSDGPILTSIQGQLSNEQSVLTAMQGSINTISSGVTSLVNTLSGLSQALSNLQNVSTQLTNVNNGVNNDQTYVLVVAALAAITLVLELAILVRKLS